MEQVNFPCGSKGASGFCPDLCQFGEFCKVKGKDQQQKPRGLAPENKKSETENIPDEDVKVEMYY